MRVLFGIVLGISALGATADETSEAADTQADLNRAQVQAGVEGGVRRNIDMWRYMAAPESLRHKSTARPSEMKGGLSE